MERERQNAIDFILERLAAGPQRSQNVITEARRAGISYATLRRAREDLQNLNVMRTRKAKGYATPWYWELIGDVPTASQLEQMYERYYQPEPEKAEPTYIMSPGLESTLRSLGWKG